ncbi:MAG: hypothetical protein IKQ92_12570 [Clostridia bacterium]|nr:hypothetical protein [Clostridia bacterium]
MKKAFAVLLILALLLSSFAACAKDADEETTQTPTSSAEPEIESEPESETEEADPFEGVDYEGRSFKIHTSVNVATVGVQSSNFLIEGLEELTGDKAPDSAIQRNEDVMQRLNVKLEYEDVDYSYSEVATAVRTLIQSGDTSYQLIINDIFGLVPITPDGLFHNANDGENFDFTRPWWYNDFMQDISINSNQRFILAGDYFIDLLRATHCLIMNKNIYTDIYGDPEDAYNSVLEKTWTYDRFRTLIEGAYRDLNGNGKRDKDDQFGFVAFQLWGPSIPWLISGDPGFIERDEQGFPVYTLNNERAFLLLEKLNGILNNDAAGIDIFGGEQGTLDTFTSGRSLFIGYQRLGSLESDSLRSTDTDLAILPYPLLDENQKDYVTSTHDTAELGFIPITVPAEDLPFVSAVIEVLCRETYNVVLPAYYDSSLKIKYTRDNTAARMIDIIHDHYGNGFPLAWDDGLGGALMKSTFYNCIENNNNDLASRIKTYQKSTSKQLGKIIDKTTALLESRGSGN